MCPRTEFIMHAFEKKFGAVFRNKIRFLFFPLKLIKFFLKSSRDYFCMIKHLNSVNGLKCVLIDECF